MVGKRRGRAHTKSRKWIAYCIECVKWRHTHHTMTNIHTGQRRCAICASVMLVLCPVCDGAGNLYYDDTPTQVCPHCGGHKVVPQQPIGEPNEEAEKEEEDDISEGMSEEM